MRSRLSMPEAGPFSARGAEAWLSFVGLREEGDFRLRRTELHRLFACNRHAPNHRDHDIERRHRLDHPLVHKG